jgi:hypothetical protein
MVQAVDDQPGNIRSDIETAFRQLTHSQSEAYKGSVHALDLEKESLEKRARDLADREAELDNREKEFESISRNKSEE